jgi:hypothetical protein
MPFEEMMAFMLNLIRTSTQVALDRFFELLDSGSPKRMSQQSYSEARQKLKPEACRELLDVTVGYVYGCDMDTWHGYYVYGIDGSKVQLPDGGSLRDIFGATGRGATAPTAQASLLYDVCNGIVASAEIEPMSVDERTLAIRHIDALASFKEISKALVIFDRGYPSFELMRHVEAKGFKFLMRLRSGQYPGIDGLGLGMREHSLGRGGETLRITVAKFALPSGEIETLATNLHDRRMGIAAYKQLYFMRWGVETEYGALKLKFEAENFSGRTETAIRQDFYITLTIANIAAVAANEAQPVIDRAREGKGNKHEYKANMNQIVGTFKDRLVRALLERNATLRAARTMHILQLVGRNARPERKNRSVPRNPNPRKSRFRFNRKSNC